MTATFSFGRFELLPANRQLLLDGQAVAIGARAFDEVLRGAASLAAKLGGPDEAIELLRIAVSLDPLNGTAIKNLGIQYLAANRVDEADAAVKMALELNPQGSFIHLWLGVVR